MLKYFILLLSLISLTISAEQCEGDAPSFGPFTGQGLSKALDNQQIGKNATAEQVHDQDEKIDWLKVKYVDANSTENKQPRPDGRFMFNKARHRKREVFGQGSIVK